MNSVAYRKYNALLAQLGEAGLNTQYPDDFEFYYTALELADSDDRTISYMGFPINPSSIQKTENKRINVKKSASGVTVISNQSPMPSEITIKGNFGRNFKILLTPNEELEGNAWGYNLTSIGGIKLTTPSFDGMLKNGFGCTKFLQKIIEGSNIIDAKTGQPNRLYFYNLALSESYLVVVNPGGFVLSQTEDQNRIWSYSLTMTVLSKIEDLSLNKDNKRSTQTLMKTQILQSAATYLANEVKDYVLTGHDSELLGFKYRWQRYLDAEFAMKYLNNFSNVIPMTMGQWEVISSNRSSNVTQEMITSFEQLKIDHSNLMSQIENNSDNFTTTEAWDLLEKMDEIETVYDTIDNYSKWSRSSNSNKQVTLDFVQKQGQSLEAISKLSGFSTYQDSWADISLNNKMQEEDYTSQGGRFLKLNYANGLDFKVNNIVDVLDGKNIYGKDISKNWEFKDGDVSTVEFDDCVDQAIDTMFSTIQGGIPEFPEDGIPNELIGSNMNTIQYPVIIRSLSKMLQKDDRFSSLELIKINKSQDNAFMEIKVTTKLNEGKSRGVSI